jgi:hypothetical protein
MDGWEREGEQSEQIRAPCPNKKKDTRQEENPNTIAISVEIFLVLFLITFLKDARFLLYEFRYGFSNRI